MWQCLSPPSTTPTTSFTPSQTACFSSILPSLQATNSGQFTVQNRYTQPSASMSYPPTASSIASTVYSCHITQAKNTTATTAYAFTGPHRPLVGNLSSASISPTASSHSQVLVGGNVFNFALAPLSVIPRSNPNSESSTKPFILKIKTNQIQVCHSCRKDYSGLKDTMGLLVAIAERTLVSNLATGTQFLGRKS